MASRLEDLGSNDERVELLRWCCGLLRLGSGGRVSAPFVFLGTVDRYWKA